MLQFGVAKELGLSLTEVRTTMTAEELLGWSAYFSILNEDQQKEIERPNAAANPAAFLSRKLKYQSVTQAVAAYRADIEIGVVGAARLKELQDRITKLSRAIDDANVKTFIDNKAVQSLGEYSGAAGKAAANLRETAIQLNAAGKASGDYANAISQLVTAVEQENSALKIQNNLIKEEIELRRKAKTSGIRY